MPLDTKEIAIGDNTYRISTLPFTKGRQLVRFAAKIAAAMAKGVRGGELMKGGEVNLEALGFADLGAVLAGALEVLTDDEMERITNLIAKHSELKQIGDKGTAWPRVDTIMDTHFAGNIGEWAMWVFENVKVNVGDFLSLTRGLVSGLARSTPTPSPSTSPTE